MLDADGSDVVLKFRRLFLARGWDSPLHFSLIRWLVRLSGVCVRPYISTVGITNNLFCDCEKTAHNTGPTQTDERKHG